jgi:hypothetical protein
MHDPIGEVCCRKSIGFGRRPDPIDRYRGPEVVPLTVHGIVLAKSIHIPGFLMELLFGEDPHLGLL